MPNLKTLGGDAPQVYHQGDGVYAVSWDHTLPSGTYPLVTVPTGDECYEVQGAVTQAFDASGVAATIGDGDDVDGYLTSANIAPATAATVTTPAVKSSRGIANPFQFGKIYATSDTVDLVWTRGTSDTTGVWKGTITIRPLASSLGLATSAVLV